MATYGLWARPFLNHIYLFNNFQLVLILFLSMSQGLTQRIKIGLVKSLPNDHNLYC